MLNGTAPARMEPLPPRRRAALRLVSMHETHEAHWPAGWPIPQHLEYLAAQGLANGTRKLRSSQLRRIARGVGKPLHQVTPEDLIAWFAAREWSLDTRRSHRAAIRHFCDWAVDEGHIDVSPARRLPRVKASIARPRPAGEDVVHDALDTLDGRTRLMVRLAAFAGLRACEIARVHRRDLQQDLVGWSLRVVGKGGRLRDVPLDETTARLIRGSAAAWLFPGRIDGHLSAHYVSKLLSRALPNGVTGHMLRHRYASAAYARGGRDLLAVRDLLGHASVATTQIYTALPNDAMRTAARAAAA